MAEGRLVSQIEDVDRQIRMLRGRGTLLDLRRLERLVLDRDRLHHELRRLRSGGSP